jgi:SAM-dependent methyltransferase
MTKRTIRYYDSNADEQVQKYEQADMSEVHEILCEAFPSGARLLELGCGSGRDAAFLLSKGFDVVVTDGSTKILDHALRIHPELRHRHRLLKLPEPFPFQEEEFDGVLAIGVFMHLDLPDFGVSLKETSRVLKANGRFFFSVPLRRDDLTKRDRDDKGRRYTALPKQDWIQECESAGFWMLSTYETEDSLGRSGIGWISFLLEKPGENSHA